MLQSEISGGTWTLKHNGAVLLTHCSEHPFATVLQREKTYAASHGSVKETVTETERVPLTELRTENGVLIFSSGDHMLRLSLKEETWGAQLLLEGEQGLAYEFCLPQLDGEAVFGGGEQYRQVNLRGESVVNLVSEHIKASTVIQKALLPPFDLSGEAPREDRQLRADARFCDGPRQTLPVRHRQRRHFPVRSRCLPVHL